MSVDLGTSSGAAHDSSYNSVLDMDWNPAAYRKLWCEVIRLEFEAAFPVRHARTGKYRWNQVQAAKYQARAWFGSKDFQQVCALGGVDSDWILDGYRKHLEASGVVA